MSLVASERASIRLFVRRAAEDGYLNGRVLDMGAGTQPYRDIIEEHGSEYTPYDAPSFPASCADADTTGAAFGRTFQAILCTQVIQYVEQPEQWLRELRTRFTLGGSRWLVLTYPTCWPEVEDEDLHRFTKAGMGRMLTSAGYGIVRHEKRAAVHVLGRELALGYGVVASP